MHGENRGCSGLDKVAFKESEKKTERKGEFFFFLAKYVGKQV